MDFVAPDIDLSQEQVHLQETQAYIAKDLTRLSAVVTPTTDFTQKLLNTLRHTHARQLRKSLHQPYFAHVFFKERGRATSELAYIGRFGLFERDTLIPIVIDWRSPIANLYYEDAFSDVSVLVNGTNELHFDVARKRQYEIKNGHLIGYFDSTNTAGINPMLLERLQERTGDRLRDIVETIQSEQNQIIRAVDSQALLVQGVAGSGKTTIALHRLSYLAYRHKDRPAFDNFLVIAPNHLFLDYISDVLPDLGVEGVIQITWEEWATRLLTKKVRIADARRKAMLFFESHASSRDSLFLDVLKQASLLRGDLALKELLDLLIARFAERIIPESDLKLSKRHTLSHAEVHKRFYEDLRHYPYMTRRERLIRSLTQWKDDCVKEAVAALERHLAPGRYLAVSEQIESVRNQYERMFDAYVRKMRWMDVFVFYKKVLANERNIRWLLKRMVTPANDEMVQSLTRYFAASGTKVEAEDLAPLLHLSIAMHGLPSNTKFAHVIVDEAQDLSPFQIAALRSATNRQSLSIFGDMAQTIYEYKGFRDWTAINEQVFGGGANMTTLRQSYRSTVEIMTFANRILQHWADPNKVLAKPVLRNGEEPQIMAVANAALLFESLIEQIASLRTQGLHNIAVIDKNATACRSIHRRLQQLDCEAVLVSDQDENCRTGVQVIPVYLSKGMEFDAVILINPTVTKYDPASDTDIKLLYVAATRALHRLYVLHNESLTPLLTQ